MTYWRDKRSPKGIQPGDVLEFDKLLDMYRGITKHMIYTVEEVKGYNILTTSGDWLWWANVRSEYNISVKRNGVEI